MNDESEDAVPGQEVPLSYPPPLVTPLSARDVLDWLHRLLACNPFYLISAALFLFGLYRLSVDPNLFRAETSQLIFNLTSLQAYELLLIGTAIFLGRRGIRYDSTLLVVLEAFFATVPFILISQAGLIDEQLVWILCGMAAALAVLRFGAIRHWLPDLPLPQRLVETGLLVLAANAALPIIFRIGEETKKGINVTEGLSYTANQVCWLAVLPFLFALVNLLPRRRDDGKSPAPRRWFPVTLFSIWALGSGAHLYALGYVYDFPLRPELLAPTLWVVAWTLCLRLTDFVTTPPLALRRAALFVPLLTTLVAAGADDNHVFFALAILNTLAVTIAWVRQLKNPDLWQMALVSVSMVAVAWPGVTHFGPVEAGGVMLAIYLLLLTILSRDPRIGMAGAVVAAIGGVFLLNGRDDCAHWAIQIGLVFFLLHSLRWRDEEHQGSGFIRGMAAFLWSTHSIVWVHGGAPYWQPETPACGLLAVCLVIWFVFKGRVPILVPVAATIVALSAPADVSVTRAHVMSTGLVAIFVSLVLFAAGTALALTKHRWLKRGGVNE